MKTRRTSLMRLTALAVSIASAHALWADATADASGQTPTLSISFDDKSLSNIGSQANYNTASPTIDASAWTYGYHRYALDTSVSGRTTLFLPISDDSSNSSLNNYGNLSGGGNSTGASQNANPFSVSVHAKLGTTGGRLLFYAAAYNTEQGVYVGTSSDGTKIIAGFQTKVTNYFYENELLANSTDSTECSTAENGKANLDEWHHYVLTAHETDGVKFYVDGTLKKTISNSDFKSYNKKTGGTDSRTISGKSYAGLYVGAAPTNTSNGPKMFQTSGALIDEVRFYGPVALDQSAVSALYNDITQTVAYKETDGVYSHYETISAALTNASSGDTVTVVADGLVTETSASVPAGVTLNIKGSTLPSDFVLETAEGSAITTDSAVAVGAITVNGATTLSGPLTMTGDISGSGKLTLSGATLYNTTASKTYTISAPLEIAADTDNTIDCGASGKTICRVTINSAMTGSGTLYCKSRSNFSCVQFQTVPSEFTGKVYGWANNIYSPIRLLKDDVSGMSGTTWDMSKSYWNICADECGEGTEGTACTSTDNNGFVNDATGLTFKFGALDAKMAVDANEFVVGSNNGDSSITGDWSAAELKKEGTGTLTLGDGSKFKGIVIRSGGGKVVVSGTIQVANYFSSETGTTLEIPLSSESASVQMTGTSSAYKPTLKGTVNITTSGDISAGTYDLITWKSSSGDLSTPTWKLNGADLPTGYTVTADTKNKKYVLTVASSDVTVDGITISSDWISEKGLSDVATQKGTTVDALLATNSTIKAANGYNYFACYTLGLDPTDANSTPKVAIVQGANGTFTVSLGGVDLADGVAIDLKLLSTTDLNQDFAEKTAEVTTSGTGEDKKFAFNATSVTGCEFFKLQIDIEAASAASGE